MRRAAFAVLAGFAVACGEEVPSGTAPLPEGREVSPVRTPSTAPASAEPASSAPDTAGRARISGEVSVTDGRSGSLALDLKEDGAVGGSLTLGDDGLAVSGAIRGDSLRAWIAGACSTDQVRRGEIVGRENGDGWEGTIAVSGNGGSNAATGTWRTSRGAR